VCRPCTGSTCESVWDRKIQNTTSTRGRTILRQKEYYLSASQARPMLTTVVVRSGLASVTHDKTRVKLSCFHFLPVLMASNFLKKTVLVPSGTAGGGPCAKCPISSRVISCQWCPSELCSRAGYSHSLPVSGWIALFTWCACSACSKNWQCVLSWRSWCD